MAHAGLAPQWDLAQALSCAEELEAVLQGPAVDDFFAQMFGREPRRWDDTLSGFDRLRCITNYFTRMRYCHADGTLSFDEKGAPGSQPRGLYPWFQVPGRRNADLNIVFGHWATLGVYIDKGIYALDSGCVWGNKLTALCLDGERRGQLTQVNCVI